MFVRTHGDVISFQALHSRGTGRHEFGGEKDVVHARRLSGAFYLWSDGERLHVWAVDGWDGWDDSIWAGGVRSDRETAGKRASGVALPMDVVDELVVMRLAELIDEKRFADAIDQAVARHGGNGGCLSLAAKAADLKAALQKLLKPEDK